MDSGGDEQTKSLGDALTSITGMVTSGGGFSGYEVVSKWCNVNDVGGIQQNLICDIDCSEGKKTIGGGGYSLYNEDPNQHSTKNGCGFAFSSPTIGGGGWEIGMVDSDICGNNAEEVDDIVVYAICVDV